MITVILALFVLLVLTAFYSGIETGLISLEILQIENESKNNKVSKEILNVIKNPSKLLGITLLGTNISMVLISTIATVFFVEQKKMVSENYLSLIISGMVLIFAEMIPKAIYRDFPKKMVHLTFPLFKFSAIIFKPFVWAISLYYKVISNLLKIEESNDFLTREDLTYFLSRTKNENNLQKFQSEMLEEALYFTKLKAKNVMIPRTDIQYITAEMRYDEIVMLASEKGFTRFPLVGKNIDSILGVLIIYDLLKYNKGENFSAKKFIHKPLICHETMDINAVLREMQKERKSIAIIIDSYGGTAGLITVEDILEEIVGEIEDEYDIEIDETDIRQINEHTFEVKGFVEIDELNTEYDFDLKEGDFETVSGLIIDYLAKIPSKGEILTIGDWGLEILDSTNRKIKKVKFFKKPNS